MKRNQEIDFAKGIGIILIILGHSYSNNQGNIIINLLHSYHVPLFFIISGTLDYFKRSKCLRKTIIQNFKSIMIPYYFFSFFHAVRIAMIRGDFRYITGNLYEIFIGYVWTALWFLPVFYISKTCFQIIKHSRWGHYIALLGLAFGIMFERYGNIYVEIIRKDLIALGFITIGFLLANRLLKPLKLVYIILLIPIHIILALYNGHVNLYSLIFGNAVLYVLNGLLGTFLVIQLGILLKSQSWFHKIFRRISYFGQNSIVLLVTHGILIEGIRVLDQNNMLYNIGILEGILITFIILLVEIPIVIFLNQYAPVVIGRKRIRVQ